MNELINNKKKVELLVDAITIKNYGDVILHKDIEDIIQEDRCSTKYSTIISKAKKILLKDHKMYIENIRGDGYRVVFPDNFAIHAIKHYDKGFKELDRGKRVLDNAPIEEMSQEGSITYRRVYDRSVILMASMNGAIVELKKLSREKSPFSPDLINKR